MLIPWPTKVMLEVSVECPTSCLTRTSTLFMAAGYVGVERPLLEV